MLARIYCGGRRAVQTIRIGTSELAPSRLVYGCMRIAGDGSREDCDKGKRAVHAAIEQGYTLFDHADIYGNGACETLFGELLAESDGAIIGTSLMRDRRIDTENARRLVEAVKGQA